MSTDNAQRDDVDRNGIGEDEDEGDSSDLSGGGRQVRLPPPPPPRACVVFLSRECPTQFITSGDDRLVKFWDVSVVMGSASSLPGCAALQLVPTHE